MKGHEKEVCTALSWVLSSSVSGSPRMVLASMACTATRIEDGVASCSSNVDRIAALSLISAATVRRWLRVLSDEGIIRDDGMGTAYLMRRALLSSTASVKKKAKGAKKESLPPDEWSLMMAGGVFKALMAMGRLPSEYAKLDAGGAKRLVTAWARTLERVRDDLGMHEDQVQFMLGWLLSRKHTARGTVPTNWWVRTGNFQTVHKLTRKNKEGRYYAHVFLDRAMREAGDQRIGSPRASYDMEILKRGEPQ